jgi:hypothetical protein
VVAVELLDAYQGTDAPPTDPPCVGMSRLKAWRSVTPDRRASNATPAPTQTVNEEQCHHTRFRCRSDARNGN